MKSKEEVTKLARESAYALIVSPGTKLNVEEATDWWWANDYNHPDIKLWQPFEHYESEGLRDVFEVFVDAFEEFAKDLQK